MTDVYYPENEENSTLVVMVSLTASRESDTTCRSPRSHSPMYSSDAQQCCEHAR
jgi:hypothetical protein